MPIHKRSDLLSAPAYAQLIEDILEGIADGTLKEGHRLASETMLKEQYNISIKSIKRGLGMLVDRGIVTRKRGSGTFVSNVNAAQPQKLVQRNTIAIVSCWEYYRYHPFYSERNKGILAGLADHGWNALDLLSYERGSSKSDAALSYRHVTPADLELKLTQHPEVAGVISLNLEDHNVQTIADNGRFVVHSDLCKKLPCVFYDWKAEIERLFRITLAKGARNICVISSQSEENLVGMCQRSVRAAGLEDKDVEFTYMLCKPSSRSTELTSQAFHLAMEAFDGSKKFDGLVITDDYEAIGVIDALFSIKKEIWSDIIITAQLSKESKLPGRIPMNALVADGYACGVTMAKLINEQITTGGDCESCVIMSCDLVEWW